ncbi:putative HTH La-type RNA-binding protein [Colletotrichum spinosum]|uniref:Putative HTH La-type RNA-binding protein n=1 Tax=Colletotrichum spinosum TaxID=1347390 RepID=A0A4R8QSZ6_9PEZI|nr:putative HTH La-type RNA-binding protein [Colletotrichum spinosum]
MATSFSYAQAAKGQAATTAATPATQSTENMSGPSSNGEQPSTEPNAVKASAIEDETSRNTSLKAQLSSKQETSAAQAEGTLPTDTSAAASVTDSRRDDEDAATEASTRPSDKSVRSASASTRVTDEPEPKKGSRKPRKGKTSKDSSDESKKDKPAEQEKEQPKIELVEAPLPSVNIWTQRKETQAAKTTVTLSSRPEPGATPAVDAWPNSQESKKRGKPTESSEASNGTVNGTKPHRKTDGDTTARRNGARGSRLAERDSRAIEVPPPVGDVTSWPTPDTAVKEIVKDEKRKPVEKTEKTESEAQDDAGSKSRPKEKWERMPFVPTVAFSTPIPSPRGSRGGRGGARGGRDVTSRGGHGASAAGGAEKAAGPSTTAKVGAEGRERLRDGNASDRTTSQPPTNKKISMDVSNTKEQRKAAAPTSGDRNKESHSNPTIEQAGPIRERGEGRGDARGRGSYRGRGGHPNGPVHGQQSSFATNGHSYGSQGPSRQYASPPMHQGGNFSSYGGNQSRGGRGGRGQPNGSFRGVGGSSSSRRQTQANMGQASWGDYGTTQQQLQWYEQSKMLLIVQLEYYFSFENLAKDEYLRKNMDSQGYVNVDLVAGFSRVHQLAPDGYLLRSALCECQQLEYIHDENNVEKVRSRTHWAKFVYPDMGMRFENARNPGPRMAYTRSYHMHPNNYDYGVAPQAGYPTGTPNGYNPYPVDVTAVAPVNGGPETQLSAHVPEFQPSSVEQAASSSGDVAAKDQPLVNGSAEAHEPAMNGTHEQPAEAQQS